MSRHRIERLMFASFVIGFVTCLAVCAFAGVVCVAKNGQMHYSNSFCPRWQTTIDLSTGPEGPTGPQGPQGPPGVSDPPMNVYDANDKLIGQDFPFYGYDGVLRTIEGVEILLPVAMTGFTDIGSQVFFPSKDCSGSEYVVLRQPTPIHFAPYDTMSLVVNGVLLYPNSSTFATRVVNSQEYVFPTGQLSNCARLADAGQQFTAVTGQLISFDLSTLGFVPPFKIK
jgi:hypothetical protein